MASSQASEVVVKDDIRQSVRSIVMDLGVNPWEVITEQYDEEEYEQVIVVLREMLESFETPRDIRPKCLKCLQAMAQRTVGSDDETSYQDNWRATREIVEQTLAAGHWTVWNMDPEPELILSSGQLPYAVDVLLEELDSLRAKASDASVSSDPRDLSREGGAFQLLRDVMRRVEFNAKELSRIIIAWALTVPGSYWVMNELVPDDYRLEDLRYVANLLLTQIDSRDTSRKTRLECIRCLRCIASRISFLVDEHGIKNKNNQCDYLLVEWALSIQRPLEVVNELVNDTTILGIVNNLLMFMSGQRHNKIKCIQCLQGVIQVTPADGMHYRGKKEFVKAMVFKSFKDQIVLKSEGFSTEELSAIVEILQEDLWRLDVSHTIRKSCVEGLQAIAQVSDLVPPIFTLDDIDKRIIKTVVTQALMCPKPWELITKLDKDEYQSAVDILQEALDSVDTSLALRASSIKCLQAISRVSDVVPSSFILEGVKKKGEHSLFRGGFADIWQGRLGSGALVCLKVLRTFNPSYYDTGEDDFKALHREALIWRQLRHPRIHPFLGIVRDMFPDQLCLVSPWSANGNLCDFLKANPKTDHLKLLIQIAEGIDYLHSHDPQIVHADIRGVNILVKDDNTCCLADFGLTMITETQAPTTTRMRSGATRWMPPEVLDTRDDIFAGGNHKLTLSTRDVYSFGCTVVEIFSGKAPFPSIKWDAHVITEVIVNRATPSRPFNYRLTDDVWRVAASCLSYDLTMRPSMQKVLSQLVMYSDEPGGRLQVHYDIWPLPGIMISPDPAYRYVATTYPLPSNSVGARKVVISAKSTGDSDLQLEVGILQWHYSGGSTGYTTMRCDKKWRFSHGVMEAKARTFTWMDDRQSVDFIDFVEALKPGDRVVLFSKEGHDVQDVSIDVFFQLG